MIPRFSLPLVLGIVLACGFAPSRADAQYCGPTNIAQGLPLIGATPTTIGGPPSIATDGKGDLTNSWFSGFYQSFVIDLGAPVPICRIVAAVRQSSVVIISSSLDGNNWEPRHSVDVTDAAHSGSATSQIDGPLTFEGNGYSARYLKYESAQKGSDAYQGLHEFAVYPSVSTQPPVLTGDNLATLPGVTVTDLLASASDYPPANVADGKPETKWLAAHSAQRVGGRWLILGQAELDLGGEVLVHGVRVRRPAEGGAHSVMVSLFDAAQNEIAWFGDGDPAVVGTDTPATGDADFVLEVPLQVRYVRVVPFNSAVSSDVVRPAVAEVEVYGAAAVPEDDTTPPQTTAHLAGTPGNGNWYRSGVEVSLEATDDEPGTLSTYYAIGGSAWASYTGPFTVEQEGVTTVAYYSVDAAGNPEAPASIEIRVDTLPPTITYGGSAGTYTTDQVVNISCAATDGGSGVASTTCQDITGPASGFPLGVNTFSATATDNAGNTGTGSVSFTVQPAAENPYVTLRQLIQQFVAKAGIANSLANKLTQAEAAGERGNSQAKAGMIKAFINEVEAQTGKALTPAQAAILIQLAQAL